MNCVFMYLFRNGDIIGYFSCIGGYLVIVYGLYFLMNNVWCICMDVVIICNFIFFNEIYFIILLVIVIRNSISI